MLTNNQIEKRLRYRLALCGFKMHKMRGADGPRYALYSDNNLALGEPMTLKVLIDHVSRMTERRKDYLVTRGR